MMKSRSRNLLAILLAAMALTVTCAPSYAQSITPDTGWPRVHTTDKGKVVVYQPQVDSWDDYAKLNVKMAIQIIPPGQETGVFGAVQVSMDTETNFQTRMVLLKNIKLLDIRFPGVTDDQAESAKQIYSGFLASRSDMTISLDRIIGAMEISENQAKAVEVNLAPPKIYYSDIPAILVILIGSPRFEMAAEGLLFAANTNWDLFLDSAKGDYYLRNDQSWLTAKDLSKGPWTPTNSLPASFGKLPNNDNWKDVLENIPGKSAAASPLVYVSEQPAELIVTQGAPSYRTIPNTSLLFVDNTDSELFLNTTEGMHYYTVAGRWFRSKDLSGPWQEASKDLPTEFQKIPETSEKSDVLASVPGSSEAEAAVLLASIPKKATVEIKSTTLQVSYEGQPKFVPIETTQVSYAVNTPDSVFLVNGAYYCCRDGIWFVSSSPGGPWVVATSVPKEIYSIPPTHPMHNVTYVYVYDSNPQTVTVGYTSGYTGSYVAATGVLMFGLGYWMANELNDDYWHGYGYHYGPAYWGYGCAAHYDYYHGGYIRAGAYYGPYGGAGRAAYYNPATGTYGRAAYAYGPNGSAYARGAYNPYTGGYAARAGANTPYGSWGRTVAGQGDDWVSAGHRSNAYKSVGGIRTSEGTGIVAGKNRITGESGMVAKNKYGDVYVGHDGNVYKRDSDGDWSKYDGNNGWTDPAAKAGSQSKASATSAKSENLSNRQAASKAGGSASVDNRANLSNRAQTTGQLNRSNISGGQGSGQLNANNRRLPQDLPRQNINRQPMPQARPAPTSMDMDRLNREYQARQRGEMQARNVQKQMNTRNRASSSSRNLSASRGGGGSSRNLSAGRGGGGGGMRGGGGGGRGGRR